MWRLRSRATAKLPLFADMSDDDLLTYGVPPEWMSDVRQADEDNLLLLADRLPGEAAEALLELATGGKPLPPQPVAPVTNPLDHPDAQRRFRVMSNVEALQRALEFPWDRWSVFLHPEQRQLVERHYTGPARVSGSARPGHRDREGDASAEAQGVLPKSPLRLLKRRNRAAFDGRSSSERSPNGEVVRKPLYGGPWIGYHVRARTAKREILV